MKTKLKVPTAKGDLNYFPMVMSHGTTDQFFRPTVPYCYELIAGSRQKIKMGNLRRVDPMVVPPMSMINFNTRFYKVPIIDIIPYYNEWKGVTPYAYRYNKTSDGISSVIPNKLPQLYSGTILEMMLNRVSRITTDNDYDNKSDDEKTLSQYTFEIHLFNNPWSSALTQAQNIVNIKQAFRDAEFYVNGNITSFYNQYLEEIYDQITDYISYVHDNTDSVNDEYVTTKSEYEVIELLYNEWHDGVDKIDKIAYDFAENLETIFKSGFKINLTHLEERGHEGYYDKEVYGNTKEWRAMEHEADISVPEVVYQGYGNIVNGGRFFRYTERGRVAFKILKQLGYDFDALHLGTSKGTPFGAQKLLAFLKVIMDYYENSAFIDNTERLAKLNSLLHIDVESYELTPDDLDLIMDLALYMTYERDYFTTGMVSPITGNNFVTNQEEITLNDPTSINKISTDSFDVIDGTPSLVSNADFNDGGITSTGIKLLKRLTDYLHRHQISGGRFVDRILAEFGVSVDNDQARRTSYIDTVHSTMNISPVLNTTSDQLGDFAGYGTSDNSQNNNIIEVTCEQDSIIIAIDTISPEIMYSQGYNRQNRHIRKFDMVTPDFDGITPGIIEQGEIMMIKDGCNYNYGYAAGAGTVNYASPHEKTFSYTSKYMENKTMIPILTGDFIVPSVNLEIQSYMTDRKFNPKSFLTGEQAGKISITQSRAFSAVYDQEQYSRIFYYTTPEYKLDGKTDYIKSIFRFEVEMWSPMATPFDNYQFDRNGTPINMEVGGQTMF